jgi:aspartate/methionine/tyrosine aminotransferase
LAEVESTAIIINSFSKYYSMAAWRLGWLVAPPADVARCRALVGNLFLTAPSLAQHAALVAMDETAELQANLAVYRENRRIILEALPALSVRSIAPPDGAFYIWADIGHLTDDSFEFCRRLLIETRVGLAPGVAFGAGGEGSIRICYAADRDVLEPAMERLHRFLDGCEFVGRIP